MRSPENCTGYERTENFASPGSAVPEQPHLYAADHLYTAPAELRLNHWALSGDWTMEEQAATLNTANGRIACRFRARDLNLVMGPAAPGTPALAFAAAAVCGVLTVAGRLPGVSAVAVGSVLASAVWLLAIGIRGAWLPSSDRARVARTARLIAATMLCSGVVTLFGFAIDVAAIAWTALVAGCLAWLSIPVWVLAAGRALVRSPAVLPVSDTVA